MAVLKAFALAGALVATAVLPAAAQTAHAKAHHAIATQSEVAQTEFDRGLSMLYAFNVGEARIAFRAAEAADPHAMLAYAGEAIADTVDINLPTTPAGEKRGADAIARGRTNAPDASPDDRAFLDAVAQRYDASKPIATRYQAYFQAMQKYADTHKTDAMAHSLAAYAGWNTGGMLDDKRQLSSIGQTMRDDLNAAVALDPDDLGAHHLLVHFWERAGHADRALPDAQYLASRSYDLGQSHLPHMAGHTYARIGAYDALIATNVVATRNDEQYFALGNTDGQQYMHHYHDHDVDFVLYGLTTIGRYADANAYAAKESDYMRGLLAVRLHDGARGQALLSEPTVYRVAADVRIGDLASADLDLSALAKDKSDSDAIVLARATIERGKHDYDAAIRDYRTVAGSMGPYLGDPKNYWAVPPGEGLGATLLEAHRYAEAETTFAAELVRFPNDPHIEFGLAEARKAQGKDDTAARRAYTEAWKGDTPLTVADLG